MNIIYSGVIVDLKEEQSTYAELGVLIRPRPSIASCRRNAVRLAVLPGVKACCVIPIPVSRMQSSWTITS